MPLKKNLLKDALNFYFYFQTFFHQLIIILKFFLPTFSFSFHRSVVTATVIYDGNSVVDLQQLEKRLTANKTQAIVEQSVQEYRSENRLLFWLLMFFIILMSIACLLLLMCCLWQGCIVCPCLEVKRKTVVSPSENLRFIAKERGIAATETKGVQGKSMQKVVNKTLNYFLISGLFRPQGSLVCPA